MRIKKLQIKNFKSLVDFELENLPSFAAIVGPNASGKSNFFEALEFANYIVRFSFEAPSFFGGKQSIYSYNARETFNFPSQFFSFKFDDSIDLIFELLYEEEVLVSLRTHAETDHGIDTLSVTEVRNVNARKAFISTLKKRGFQYDEDYEIFIDNFSRIFIGKNTYNRSNQLQSKLNSDASNLSQILGQIFDNELKKNEFIEWLQILIPEFKNIEVKKSNLDGSFEFFLYEKTSNKPFPKYLISDGTYNILSLMAAVYQSDSPQFLCIEEPENGLHPQAIQLLVDFFREKCEENNHHILLNTHSQTLVRCLEPSEIILVNKVDGETKAKQLSKEDNIDIKTDEAWLSNAFGGGVLWSK